MKELLIVQMIFLFSCAYIPKGIKMQYNAEEQNTKKCEKISARFGLIEHLPFEIKFLKHSELKENVESNAEAKILTLIKESGNFNSSVSESSKDLILGFTIYRETHNYGLLWLPALTLGIIPAKMSTDYSLGLRVFKTNGELLKEYKSTTRNFDYYVGLWFIPLSGSDEALNLRDIENKFLPVFFDELMQALKKDKIIACN